MLFISSRELFQALLSPLFLSLTYPLPLPLDPSDPRLLFRSGGATGKAGGGAAGRSWPPGRAPGRPARRAAAARGRSKQRRAARGLGPRRAVPGASAGGSGHGKQHRGTAAGRTSGKPRPRRAVAAGRIYGEWRWVSLRRAVASRLVASCVWVSSSGSGLQQASRRWQAQDGGACSALGK